MESTNNITMWGYQRALGIFTLGDVRNAFDADFLDIDKCRVWIMERLHGNQALCPECCNRINDDQATKFWRGDRVKCPQCEKYFTALTGTFLSGCHFNFRQIFLLYYLIALKFPDKEIARIIKITPESVRLWRLKVKELDKIKS